MVVHNFIHRASPLILAISLILTGCGGEVVSLDSAAHESLLTRDRVESGAGETITLTLSEAIDRGIKENLDARVAALEVLVQDGNVTLDQLNALPSLKSSRGYVGRSNDGASSSRSVISGLQSLEPSQSTETDRLVSEFTASWNLLDAALALNEAQSTKDETKIAGERYTKVIQNIERDIYSAYWRALAFQNSRGATKRLLVDCEDQNRKVMMATDERLLSASTASEKISRLADRQRTLRDYNNKLSLADYELKGLLSLSQNSNLVLKQPTKAEENAYKALLSADIKAQEWAALKNRPEMREDILQKNVALRNIRSEIIKTLPGADLMFSYNNDSNKYLQDDTWMNFSASIVQNILNVFTAPARISAAQDKATLEDAKRQALSAAILAQVHIARHRLENSQMIYNDTRIASRITQRRAEAAATEKASGLSSGYDALVTRMEGQIESIRAQMAYADLQDSYAAFANTLGQRLSVPGGGL